MPKWVSERLPPFAGKLAMGYILVGLAIFQWGWKVISWMGDLQFIVNNVDKLRPLFDRLVTAAEWPDTSPILLVAGLILLLTRPSSGRKKPAPLQPTPPLPELPSPPPQKLSIEILEGLADTHWSGLLTREIWVLLRARVVNTCGPPVTIKMWELGLK